MKSLLSYIKHLPSGVWQAPYLVSLWLLSWTGFLPLCNVRLFLIQYLQLHYFLTDLYQPHLLGFHIWPGPAVQQLTLVTFLVLTTVLAWCQVSLVSPSRCCVLPALLKTSSTLRWTRASLGAKPLRGASFVSVNHFLPLFPPSFFLIPFFSFSPLLTASFLVLSFSLFYPTFSLPPPFLFLSPFPFFPSAFLFFPPFVPRPSFLFLFLFNSPPSPLIF